MYVRVDLECELGHRQNNVVLHSTKDSDIVYPMCSLVPEDDTVPCGAKMEQVYDNRKETEGYWVIRGANW